MRHHAGVCVGAGIATVLSLVVGGVIVFDDYGGDGMDGVQQAVHEIASKLPGVLIHNLNGHALLVKVQS